MSTGGLNQRVGSPCIKILSLCPVLCYSYRQVGDHDDDEDVLLPDHPPEGLAGLVERALRVENEIQIQGDT